MDNITDKTFLRRWHLKIEKRMLATQSLGKRVLGRSLHWEVNEYGVSSTLRKRLSAEIGEGRQQPDQACTFYKVLDASLTEY